ncbi:hypothetical protein [Nocardiopsis composta]|uniref:Uncharacterized protein n=1 Tax=Nocardiopsis composta TaxID=157465 RepID=A0A7W8QPN6_9ACTN|nr:hypothetical protein [Nocardiopsis composta]MBB5434176.1 hypothetical protein [Nocardiopsis composta]
MHTTTVRISGVRIRGRTALWNGLAVLLFLLLIFGLLLHTVVDWDMSFHGMPLGEALWAGTNRRATVAVAVLGVLLLAVVAALAAGAPRSRARREVRVGPAGIELVARPAGWYRGRRAMLPWENVQLVSAPRAVFAESAGTSVHRASREVLDLYLFRGVEGLPDFARAAAVDGTPLDGLHAPAVRVRIGGAGNRLAASVRELAAAVDAARPGLFYRGTAVDQWFTPSVTGGEAAGTAPTVDAPAGYALPGAVWLDFRTPPLRTFGTLAGLVLLAAACYPPIHLLSRTDGGILAGLVGLVLMVPFLVGVCGALFSVLVLPRALARIGILVDPDGLVLVEKRPWRLRGLVRGRIPWGDVQAIVARGSAVLGVHGVKRAQERPVVDVYLRGDTAFRRLGVGLPVEVTRQGGADSARVRELVGFPAVRLRLVPSLGGGPRTGGEDLADQGPGPVRLPGARSRSALHAARPDLCHGFGDRGATGS